MTQGAANSFLGESMSKTDMERCVVEVRVGAKDRVVAIRAVENAETAVRGGEARAARMRMEWEACRVMGIQYSFIVFTCK